MLKEYQVSTLPDEVSDVEGAVVEPASVAAYGIDRVGVRGGDVVLVTGAGPIGVLSAMYADAARRRDRRHRRAQPEPRRARRARSTSVRSLDPTADGFAESIADLTGGRRRRRRRPSARASRPA